MAGILHNVIIKPAEERRAAGGLFLTVSRTDGKTVAPPAPQPPPPPRRSGPQRCPLCGTTVADTPNLFRKRGRLFECRVCSTRINEIGALVVLGVDSE